MRISRETAKNIANQLTEKSKEKWRAAKDEYAALVISLYKAQVPSIIWKALKDEPSYIELAEQIKVEGFGFAGDYVTVPEELEMPIMRSSDWHRDTGTLKMTEAIAAKLRTAKNKEIKAEKTYKDLNKEINQAILSLGTLKRISESIPAAAPMLQVNLPVPAVIVNMSALNKKIANQESVEAANG